jgi:hypothetical protein
MWCTASVTGRVAREALAGGEGEVCAAFRRSFYLRFSGGRYACVGDASLGRGPLNALTSELHLPELGARISIATENASLWEPQRVTPALPEIRKEDVPGEGFGCLLLGMHNPLALHAQPALQALDDWLSGATLRGEAQSLIGLGPGLTPSGDDYLGGVLIALRLLDRGAQADSLWRRIEPLLAARTSAISAAHLAAAAAGEGHEALHDALSGSVAGLGRVGHCSGWDALAGAGAVLGTRPGDHRGG